jgi:hypothetical protein
LYEPETYTVLNDFPPLAGLLSVTEKAVEPVFKG